MRVSIIGSGYVGLVTAACLAELGHQVLSIDSDQEKIATLQRGAIPIHERFLPELVQRHHGRGLEFSTDLARGVAHAEVLFIAVGTPALENGEADLSYIESVASGIAQALDGYKLIVEKSTVPVYTNEWIRRTLLRDGARPEWFDVASNPEFLREGTAVQDFLYPDRIVLGADEGRALSLLQQLYSPLTEGTYAQRKDAVPQPEHARLPAPVIVTTAKSAEIIKHASNSFLAMKISFINAVSVLCETVGADITAVCRGIGTDARIGEQFLRPGLGYGGSCFAKDLKAFRAIGREAGYDFRLLEEIARINEEQRQFFLRKVRKVLWNVKDKRLAVLGLSFKGGTDDIRESPAIALVQALSKEGASLAVFDPAATENARKVLPEKNISYAADAYDAARGAHALLIATDWQEFATLDLDRLRAQMRYPIIIDGRNLYDPALMATKGFTYCSIGRPYVASAVRTAATGT